MPLFGKKSFDDFGGPDKDQLTQKAIEEAKAAAEATAELERKLYTLTRICRALWSFIQENHAHAESELAERFRYYGLNFLEDGAELMEPGVEPCRKCNRPRQKRQKNCLYCGEPRPRDSVFDEI